MSSQCNVCRSWISGPHNDTFHICTLMSKVTVSTCFPMRCHVMSSCQRDFRCILLMRVAANCLHHFGRDFTLQGFTPLSSWASFYCTSSPNLVKTTRARNSTKHCRLWFYCPPTLYSTGLKALFWHLFKLSFWWNILLDIKHFILLLMERFLR